MSTKTTGYSRGNKSLSQRSVSLRMDTRSLPLQHRLQKKELKNFDKVESGSGKKYFLKDGAPYLSGDRFWQI
jgi:membrane-bound inhibitor of C-type lysozyme